PVINTPIYQLSELFPDLKARIVGLWRQEHMLVPQSDDQLMAGDEAYFIADKGHVSRTLDILGHDEREARRVVLLGGGNIGRFVARELEKWHLKVNVKVIESDKDRAEAAAEHLSRTVVLHGSGLDQALLREAGIADTETIVALTNQDQVNILSCVLAKKEGARRSVSLINDRTYAELMRPLGIDAFIDPRATTVSTILQNVRRGRIKALHSVRNGLAEAIEAEALKTSPLVGVPLREVNLPDGLRLGAVYRDGEVLIPDGDMVIEANDRVTVFALREAVSKVEQMFRVSLEYF
ncbi:MAG: Trk system potassium transporter TrkA, partial [Pseudomonadota bacterium]